MKTKLTFVLCLLSVFQISFSQSYQSVLLPENLKNNANAIVRESTVDIEIVSPKKMVQHVKYAVTVLNETGRSEGFFREIYDNFESLSNIKIVSYNTFGKQLKKAKSKEIDDLKYFTGNYIDDVRMKKYNYVFDEYPYTVVYEYTKTYDGFVAVPGWYPYRHNNVAVEKASYSLTYPEDYAIDFKEYNIDTSAVTKEADEQIIKSWQIQSLPGRTHEPFSANGTLYLPRVSAFITHIDYDGYQGDLTSWNSFGNWIYDLRAERSELPDELKQKLNVLTADASSDLEKVKIVYDYLQNSTRYISIQLGIGGWQPLSVESVYERGYGDCKALSNYMVSMLNYLDIEAYNTIIKNGKRKVFRDKSHPSFSFNHAIACVPLSSDTVWLECTSQRLPFGYIGKGNADKNVMLVTPQGGFLVKTPKFEAEQNLVLNRTYCELFANGDINISYKNTYRNEMMGQCFEQVFSAEKDRKIGLYEKLSISNAHIESFNYELDKENFTVTEEVNLQAPKYASQGGDYLFVPITPSPDLFNFDLKPNKKRFAPIEYTGEYRNVDTVITKLPEGFTCQTAAFDSSLTTPFGEYRAIFYTRQNELIFVRDLTQQHKVYEKSQVDPFIEFNQIIDNIERIQIVIQKQD